MNKLEDSLQYKPLTEDELEDLGLTKREYKKVQNIVKKNLKNDYNSESIMWDCAYNGIYFPEKYLQREINLAEEKKKVKDLEREVVEENVQSVKKVLEKTGDVLKKGLDRFFYGTLGSFTYPTAVRKYFEHKPNKSNFLNEFLLPVVGGMIVPYAICVSSYIILNDVCPEIIPFIAIPQIATNLASGIYEYKRHVKNKAKERLVEQDS